MLRCAVASRMPTSRSTSVLAEPQSLPWLYPYREDPQSVRLGEPIFRPFVYVSLACGEHSTTMLEGLIDTGADAVLASDLLAEQLGIDLTNNEGETPHAVGGRTMMARYKTVSLRLHPRDGPLREYREWEAQVGFVQGWHSYSLVLLGSVGFLDCCTVTASRFAQAVAVENRDAFDERFGTVLGP
jgi:hypothetical protein